MPAPSRLRWKCRRGMREMDILMNRFLERGYDSLDDAGREAFEHLLDLPDQDILRWIWSHEQPADPRLASLMAFLRDVVRDP